MPIFTQQDLDFFDHNGYVILHDAVPAKNLHAVIDAVFDFLDMNPNDPNDWYREPHRTNGMVELYQHQALWDNRMHPRVHAAFSEIYGTDTLWVSEDRACMKPPMHPDHPDYDHKGFTHWDVDTSKLPLPFRVQGVLALTDTTTDMGGFQCVPGFHRDLDKWIAAQPADRNPWQPDLNALPLGMAVTPIPMKAGDLLIWTTLLAHGNGHNVSNKPRLAQYITMSPADINKEDVRLARIDRWQNRKKPTYDRAFPGDPRRLEELHGTTAVLTPLGRKLLGLDAW
jgi:hypothetical protein